MQGCKGFWGWCAGSVFQPFTANLSWDAGQPEFAKEKDNCLHLRIFQNSTETLLSDRECKDKYIFACKAKIVKIYNFIKIKIVIGSLQSQQVARVAPLNCSTNAC